MQKDLQFYLQRVANIYTKMDESYVKQVDFRIQPGSNIEFISNSGEKFFFPISYPTLYRLAETLKPKKYMEIGSQGGFSASIVASASPETNLFLFDCPGCGYGGFPESKIYLEKHMQLFAPSRHAIQYGKSNSLLDKMQINAPYDMVYIDGDHSYHGAKKDWEMVKTLIKSGSVVVIDDITHEAHKFELNQLFEEMLKENMHSSYEKHLEETGIGVIYIK